MVTFGCQASRVLQVESCCPCQQKLCDNELFRDGCGKSHEIAFSMTVQMDFKVNLSRAHYDTLFTKKGKMIKACEA